MSIEKQNCCGCSACADICRQGAIHMERDEEGFAYPRTDKALCTGCNQCRSVCPMQNAKNHRAEGRVYLGVQAKAEEIRYSSSSGGMFSVLAQWVLARNGSVYGAGYGDGMEVLHRRAEDTAQLETIKKTKYVQSKMEGIYCEIHEQLELGRWVLFCGTPCQGYALRRYLKKTYDKLVLVDMVCYGVPSPGIWKAYVRYLERKHRGKMADFSFRDKRNQDNGHVRSYKIGAQEYVGSLYQDIYCKLYFRNYILRPSCHRCKFCGTERSSDFTIGDFWGIERVLKRLDDGMGTSMVILHTDKAKRIWGEVQGGTRWFACERQDILQPALVAPVVMPKDRGMFMRWYRLLPFPLFLKLAAGALYIKKR